MKTPIRIVQYGLGHIGLDCARLIRKKESTGKVQLVGALDIDPAKAGRDLAELLNDAGATGICVSDDADRVLSETSPEVVLHCTNSFLEEITDQLEQCARAGAHVISSTEELFFPYQRHPELAARLDRVARDYGVVFLGTGVNPGFAMDTLVLTATGACCDVRRISVERVVDAGERRLPLQQKVGAGLSRTTFKRKKKTGSLGHIGLLESLHMVADGLGWSFDRVEETLNHVISEKDVKTRYLTVSSGEVAGIHHRAVGYQNGAAFLTLDLKRYVGADEEYDRVLLDGSPPIDLKVHGGIFGDTATVGTLVNAIPLVLEAKPGLRTSKDIPVPRAFATISGHTNDR